MTIVSIALAASTLVTPPAPDGAADGETSTEATPSNNVELALGADGNADGDLSTDETDFLIGWRGDRWVAFDAAGEQ